MIRLPARSPAPTHWRTVFGAAVSLGPADFCVLAYCADLDEQEIASNPLHQQFTFIFRFIAGQRQLLARLPERLNDLWASPTGVAYGVGAPRGVLEIRGTHVSQVSIDQAPGSFWSIWGTSEDHVFACGSHRSFWLYRRYGVWHELTLPIDAGGLWRVNGFKENDVYAVTDLGEILHFDGESVRRLDSPTTRWLTSIAVMPGNRLCIGGYDGTLLYGDLQGWRTVNTGADTPLFNMVPYRHGVSFVTGDGLWWFNGANAPQLLSRQGGRWLNAIGDMLMVVDGGSAWLFDGTKLQPLDTAV